MGNTSSSQEYEIRNPVMIGTQGEVMGINQGVGRDDDTVYIPVTQRVIRPILDTHRTYISDDIHDLIGEYVNANIQENKRQQVQFNHFADKFNKKFQDLEYPNIQDKGTALDTLLKIKNTRIQLSNYSRDVENATKLTPNMKDSLNKKILEKDQELKAAGTNVANQFRTLMSRRASHFRHN